MILPPPSPWWQRLDPRFSLRSRFALAIIGAGLVLALFAALLIEREERKHLTAATGLAMHREGLLVARGLEAALQERLEQLRALAQQPVVSSGLMEPADLRQLLETMRVQQPAWGWLGIADNEGRLQVATNALQEGELVSNERWYREGRVRSWIGTRRPAGPLTENLGLVDGRAPYLIDLALPLKDLQGRTWGVLHGRLRWEWLNQQFHSMDWPDSRPPGQDVTVLDLDGQVLLGAPERLDQPLAVARDGRLLSNDRPRLIEWPGEGEFLTAAATAVRRDDDGAAGLTVVVRQPSRLAFGAAEALQRRMLVGGAVVALLFGFIGVWLAGRVTRPVKQLAAEAVRVAQGQPPAFGALASNRRDEVAVLARQLQDLHQELDQQLQAQLVASERFQLLFQSMPLAVYFLREFALPNDPQVRLRLDVANDACLPLFGVDSHEALKGLDFRGLFDARDHAFLAARQTVFLEAPRGVPLPPVELHVRRRDGRLLTVESRALPVALEGGLRGVQVVLRDVTEERAARELLQRREAQLQMTSRIARVGGWRIEVGTGRGAWTDEMARIYEMAPETMPTRALALDYFYGHDRDLLDQAVAEALAHGTPYDLELLLQLPSGHQKWLRIQGQPVMLDGQVVAIEGIAQDVSERRAAQDALRDLNAELEQRVAARTAELQAANSELDSFAYAVSHDLRAPLRAMSGFSQALVEDYGDQLEAGARSYLEHIIQGSQRMGGLIEGLLTLSRTVRGELQRDEIDLSAMASRTITELRRNDPGRAVSVEIEPGLHATGDRRMLDAAIHNLLGNAWKYTQQQPQAHIRFYAVVEGGQRWFAIEDNGAGFDMAHAGRLFKAFARLHRQDEFPGLGIGLATVQRIIRRHGGQLEGSGRPGAGACFRFTLPAVPTTPLN